MSLKVVKHDFTDGEVGTFSSCFNERGWKALQTGREDLQRSRGVETTQFGQKCKQFSITVVTNVEERKFEGKMIKGWRANDKVPGEFSTRNKIILIILVLQIGKVIHPGQKFAEELCLYNSSFNTWDHVTEASDEGGQGCRGKVFPGQLTLQRGNR